MQLAIAEDRLTLSKYDFHPSVIYLSKTNKHINRANQFKKTYNIGLDAKVHVGLFNRLHVTHKNNTKVEMIYNHITPKYTHTNM